MTYKSIRFENIGPIAAGEVRRHPISVFIGPTGSGKSIAARLIHGVCHLAASRAPRQLDLYADGRVAAERIAAHAGHSIAKSAGIPVASVPTHKARSSLLEIVTDARLPRKIDYAKLAADPAPDNMPRPPHPALGGRRKPSVYVPAGSTGIVRSYASMARIRNALLHAALGGGGGDCPARPGSGAASGAPARNGSPGAPRIGRDLILPEHLELFYDTVFRSLAGNPTESGARMVSRIFGSSVGGSEGSGSPTTAYTSRDGSRDEITSAASVIVSSFPAIECARSVERGGLLIVEEPEAHLEPMRQLLLVEELARAARSAPFDLILITHSDHTLDSVQSLVASGQVGRDDIGLYYFERKDGSHTRIRPVPIDKDGTAEQDMFEDAIDALSRRFA